MVALDYIIYKFGAGINPAPTIENNNLKPKTVGEINSFIKEIYIKLKDYKNFILQCESVYPPK